MQGGIDLYEGALDAAKRELKEETGVTSARVVSTVPISCPQASALISAADSNNPGARSGSNMFIGRSLGF